MSVMARSTPYVELPAKYAHCSRCGIIRQLKSHNVTSYCRDCLPEARRLGWAPQKGERHV